MGQEIEVVEEVRQGCDGAMVMLHMGVVYMLLVGSLMRLVWGQLAQYWSVRVG